MPSRNMLLPLVSLLVAIGMVLSTAATSASQETATSVIQFTVDARHGWQDTGIAIYPGMSYEITYVSGVWAAWPGAACDASGCVADPYEPDSLIAGRHGSVLARIGNNPPF